MLGMKINFMHVIKKIKTLPTKKNKHIFIFSYQETALKSQEKIRKCSSEHNNKKCFSTRLQSSNICYK